MSHDAAIDVQLLAPQHDVVHLLTVLVDAGWSPWDPDYEHIGFYTLGESSGYAYEYAPRSAWPTVLSAMRATSSHLETMMIKLYAAQGMVELLIAADRRSILFSIANYSRRKLAEATVLTDFTWYLEHLVLPLERAGIDSSVSGVPMFPNARQAKV